MQYNVRTFEEYYNALPENRVVAIKDLIEVIRTNLLDGFEEFVSYGHMGFVVPFSRYPNGYHCDQSQPLPFISVASQKNHIALYHMGIYMNPSLLNWFKNEYPKYSNRKLNMGKSCIRFTNIAQIPLDLIGELVAKMSVEKYIEIYENALNLNNKS